ncbi:MAG TPA: ribonuclease H-like domain-containing protein [Soehngenia sp.]|nr:ribonuclease H-like domain-containing protein [Soehngenia sp.]
MKIIKENISYPKVNVHKPINNNLSFLDIETTGLNNKYAYVYLIGVLNYDYSTRSYKLIQYFAEGKNEEVQILRAFVDDFNPDSLIVTYNGDTFDIPFLKARLQKYNIMFEFKVTKDIYRDLTKNKMYLNLDNYKLKTIEKFLGIDRTDTYTGLECIEFYKEYLITKSDELLDKILKHNYQDIYYLPQILQIYDLLEDLKRVYIEYDEILYEFIMDNIDNYENTIVIKGDYNPHLHIDINLYLPNFTVLLSKNGKFEVDLYINNALDSNNQIIAFLYDEDVYSKNSDIERLVGDDNNIIVISINKKFIINNMKIVLKNIIYYAINKVLSGSSNRD